MSKSKSDYPQNKGIRARQEAVYRGFSRCRTVLVSLRDLGVANKLPESLRSLVESQINDALATAEIASEAMAGEDE